MPSLGKPVTPADIDIDAVFDRFKRGVAKQVSGDYEARLALGEAYREMGLFLDARREAATAIQVAPAVDAAEAALRILLTAPVLSARGLELLRRLLRTTPR